MELTSDFGWGWDDNVFWSLAEDPGHLVPPGLSKQYVPVTADHFLFITPKLVTWYSPSPRHELLFLWNGQHRQYIHEKWREIHNAKAQYSLRLVKELFLLGDVGGELDTRGKNAQERFYGATGHLKLSWRHHPHVALWGGYHFRALYFPDESRETDGKKQVNIENGLVLGGRWRAWSRLKLEFHYNYLDVSSNKDFHDHDSHRIYSSLELRLFWKIHLLIWGGFAYNLFSTFHLPGQGTPEKREDFLFWTGAKLECNVLDWMSIWALYSREQVQIDYSDEKGQQYRQQVLAGLGFQWEFAWHSKRHLSAVAKPATWMPKGPAVSLTQNPTNTQCLGQWVHFRLQAPKAKSVAVIGDFNGWQASRAAMKKTKGGWTLIICLPPGRHLYTFKVDGKVLSPPPKAQNTAPDGFGGYNGIVFVKRKNLNR